MYQVRIAKVIGVLCVSLMWLGSCADWEGLGAKRCQTDAACVGLGLQCLPTPGATYSTCQAATIQESQSEPPQDTKSEPAKPDAAEPAPERRVEIPTPDTPTADEPPPERTPLDEPPPDIPTKPPLVHPCQSTTGLSQCTCIPNTFSHMLGRAHDARVTQAVYLNDGSNTLVTGDSAGTLKVWQTNKPPGPKNPLVIKVQNGAFFHMAVYKDWVITAGAQVLSTTKRLEKNITVWQFSQQNPLQTQPKGRWVFQPNTGELPLKVAIGPYKAKVPSKLAIIVGTSNGALYYRSFDPMKGNIFSNNIYKEGKTHTSNNISALAYHPQDTTFAAAGNDNSVNPNPNPKHFMISTWSVKSRGSPDEPIIELLTAKAVHSERTARINALAFDPVLGNVLFSVASSGELLGWHYYAPSGSLTKQFKKLTMTQDRPNPKNTDILSVAVTGKGFIATTNKNGSVQTWLLGRNANNLPTEFGYKQTLTGHSAETTVVAFLSTGEQFASVGFDSNLRLWKFNTNKYEADTTLTWQNDGPLRDINALALSPDHAWVAAASTDGTLHIYATDKTKAAPVPLPWQSTTGLIHGVAYNATGTILGAVSSEGQLVIFKLDATGKPGPKQDTQIQVDKAAVYAIKFHPTRPNLFATGDHKGQVKVWQLTNEGQLTQGTTPLVEFTHMHNDGKARPVRSLAFSYDGKRLASGGEGSDIRVWDWEKKTPTKLLQAQLGMISGVSFWPTSADHLLSVSGHKGDFATGGPCDKNCTLSSWHIPTGNKTTLLHNMGVDVVIDAIRGLGVHPGGRWFATASLARSVPGTPTLRSEGLKFWTPKNQTPNPASFIDAIKEARVTRPGEFGDILDQFQSAAAGWGTLVAGTKSGQIQVWKCSVP